MTIALQDLLNGGAGARLESGEQLTAGQLRRLAAAAEFIPFVLGGESEILDQGRARRLCTPEQRIALELRDGGCVFPHCERPPEECQAHHKDPFNLTQSSRTDITEMALFCKTHHSLVEPDITGRRDQWSLEFNPATGLPVVIPPKRYHPRE